MASCPERGLWPLGQGSLVGVFGLHAVGGVIMSRRAWVLGQVTVGRACLGLGGTFAPSQDCS